MAGCADAGKDQRVVSNTAVTLDATTSKPDFYGEIKTYHWKQVKGQKVQLSDKKSIRPTFTAPTVQADTVLVFRLTTVERGGYHSPWRTRDRVSITVKPSTSTNNPPTAKAEVNATHVKYGDSVTFTGNASSDSDGQIVSYAWKDENNVALSVEAQFNYIFATTGTHSITLTVTDDDGETSTDSITVTVQELQKPIALIHTSTSAVTVGQSITFDANASSDADGQIVSYTWLDDTNTTLSNQKSFSHTFTTSGEHNISLVVMDDDGLEGKDSVNVVVEAFLVSVSIESLSASLEVNATTTLTATANYNDNTTQDVSSSVEWTVADTSILTVDANGTLKAHKSGTTTVQAKVGNIVSNTMDIEVQEAVVLQSISVSPNPVNLRVGNSVQVNVAGRYSDGSTKNVEEVGYTLADTSIATVDTAGSVDGLEVGSTTLSIQAGTFNASVAVKVAKELNTTNFNSTNFGNTYIDQIPTDATIENYDEKRFCMIAGQIKAEDGTPLQGVRVSIHNHPEYGTVITDSNGSYAIPAEGGLQLTMRYTKTGFTTVDRNIQAPVQDWVRTDDVTMLEVDTKVTAVNLANAGTQIHISTPITDDRGERATTLVFDGVSKATVTSANGSTREITNLNVRATEFKTPPSMPGDLPQNSAFTYCSDLTVDGVKDNEEVSFDAPVIMYVENFLGFEVGEIVPVGYYDRKDAKWKASDNGVVVKLLDTDADGKVDALDSNGSDTPNDLNGDGSFTDEVAGLVGNPKYVAGATYWRAAITHFTPWDHNWPYGPPEDSEDPDNPDVDDDDTPPNDCQANINSYVTKKSRVFHEDIPVAGTDITLHYSSKRVGGYDYIIDTKVDTTSAPSSALSAVATLEVGGKIFTKELTLGEVNQLSFVWDGKDILDSQMSGEVTAKLTVKYVYNMVYYRSTRDFTTAWARTGSSATAIRGRTTLERSTVKDIKLNVENTKNDNSNIANGWTLSNIHSLGTNIIYRGDGSNLNKKIISDSGLIAYYQFEDNLKDSFVNHYDGVSYGNIIYSSGLYGKGTSFSGNNYIQLSNNIVDTNSSYSVSFWIKSDDTPYVNSYLISNGGETSAGEGFAFYLNGTAINFATANAKLKKRYIIKETLDFKEWTHILGVYTKDKMYLYINGKLSSQPAIEYTEYAFGTVHNIRIGAPSLVNNYYMYKGNMDEIRIYNKELSPIEAHSLYSNKQQWITVFNNDFISISDNTLEYQFNVDGRHLSTSSYPDKKPLEAYTYDANGYVESFTDNFNQTTTITRDANGNPTQITAPNGQVTHLSVDENGDLVEVRYEDNSHYTFSYYDGSLMDIMTDPNGNIIKHNYNDIGRIVEEIDGVNGSYQFLRNVSGGETFYSTILPEGETSSSRDKKLANGDVESTMTLATGESVTATFAADESRTASLRDGVRSVSTYTTDTLTHQRILASRETTQPSGLKKETIYTTTYDGNNTHTNSKTQTITTNGKATTLMTDYNNGVETLTTPESRTAVRHYDIDTLLTTSTQSGTTLPTHYSYDDKGRVTDETTGTRTTHYTYDARGNLATRTNPRGEVTHYSYDIMDRVQRVTYANNTTEHFSYDANGNLLTRTVPTPAEHTFGYNGANLRTGYTSPLNKATIYHYDRSKNLTNITKPSGVSIDYHYTNGRLESINTPEGSTNYSYLFADKVGSITQGSESFSFTYDGSLLTRMVQSGTLNATIDYHYNNDFLMSSISYAGATYNYMYDNDGLLLSSGALGNAPYSMTRDAQNGYVTQLSDGTLIQNRSYNDHGEVVEISDNTFTYELSQRDEAGAITQKKETLGGTERTYDYSYDEMGRLIEVKKDGTTVEAYTYDANGNRASATVHGESISASYTLDDSLVVYGNNSYLYNEDGYLKEKTTPEGKTTYSYGSRGELLLVTTPSKSISYLQNALNQRVAKKVDGVIVEKYLWKNLTTLLAIYDKDDNLVQRFEYADQRMPVAMTDTQGTKYYLHYDQVGSLRAISDSSHNLVKEIVYDTYGNILTDSNPSFTIPFGFAGGLYDADTKLTRFGYRDYDGFTGKWTAKDPIGFDGGDSNLYGYVLGDPVGYFDPKGLEVFPELDPDTSDEDIIQEEKDSEDHINDFDPWTTDNQFGLPEQPDEDTWCNSY